MIASSNADDPLPAETESRITAFTELVATAISNSEARVEVGRLAGEQAALRRGATPLAPAAPPTPGVAPVAPGGGGLPGGGGAGGARFGHAAKPTRRPRRGP